MNIFSQTFGPNTSFIKRTFSFILLLTGFTLQSQPPLFKTPAYINNYSEIAVQQMIEYKIPASVILAQAIFESNCGTSTLARRSNNHFGIKCHTGWAGDTIVKTDDTLNECFRSYQNVDCSYTDHSLFLVKRARYASLFDLKLTDYKGWCKGLKSAGYATYGRYADELIAIIEQNRLFELDGFEKMETIAFEHAPSCTEIFPTKTARLEMASLVNAGLFGKKETDYTVTEIRWMTDQGEEGEAESNESNPPRLIIKDDGIAGTGDIAESED